ncbi:prolyl oligopeptidase family serine peptidase [Streptomyces sp. ME19-01-6]|uniref:prolyl oligopeptidase family serine peptidase n=1 Tax=Streptomyces sp. ME19-01-6 TaxID=3028686 RepID=UPI0029B87C4D|nr:prolyl oligopeptidase family serine peptidase [Streptomyces sp. ME19-01-6]MDX3231883.1 prolyl oligopeptidase family serine peptidase [Streptomyces sp. ME19-01-6]
MYTRTRTRLIVGVALAALTAISTSNHATAAPSRAAQTISNIEYAPAQPAGSKGHLLDLYLPDTGNTLWPLVMSSSQAVFPAQVYDIKAAVRWLRAHAAQYRLDPDRFALMGDSSGGWVADMATMTGGVASLEGDIGTTGVSSSVQAGVGLFGPTDFLQMNAQRLPGGLDHDAANSPESMLMGCAIQTCPDKVGQANPITYVDQNDPPMLLAHGQADLLVPHGQSVLLYDAIKAKCGNARFFSVPDAGHGAQDVLNPSHYGAQTVRTTTGCQESTSTGAPDLSWDTIAEFLDDALNVGGTSTARR